MLRFYRSLRRDATCLIALIADPVQSRSYYPEQPRKSKLTILTELIWWWLRYREANKYYYLYGLDRAGAGTEEIMSYRHFRALRNSRNLRPQSLSAYYGSSYNFVCVLRDKFVFSQLAASLGFPVPKVWAVCTRDSLLWVDTGEAGKLEALLSEPGFSLDAVCKPTDGIMGTDVFLLKVEKGQLFIGGQPATLEEFRHRLTGRHILQSRVSQHPKLSELHANSVNTLRLVTYNEDGAVSLFSAGFRVGAGGGPTDNWSAGGSCGSPYRGRPGGGPTDNWSAGGILVAIDSATGCLKGEGYMKPAFGLRVDRHPDSGIVFEGFEIPMFHEAVDLVVRLHAYLPGLHSIGWDIAITPEGPTIVEGNDDWDGAVSMVLDSGFRQKFTAMYSDRVRDRLPAPPRIGQERLQG